MKKLLLVFVILLLLGGGALAAYIRVSLGAADTGKTAPGFSVVQGDSLSAISARLKKQGLIRDDRVFKYYGVYKKLSADLKVGEYDLDSSMSVVEIYEILLKGRQKLVSVTIPEGYTIPRIAALLEDRGITSAEDFQKATMDKNLLSLYGITSESAEGYLFPDTYSFQQNYPALRVTEHMLKTFFKNLEQIYPSYKMLTEKQLKEKVIMASIIEREYRDSSEAARIASVFYNRIDREMKLQSCATVMFVITEINGDPHPDRLLFSHLEIDSDYNTYKYKGIPPGAISNPGFVALNAAFYPETTDYLYFVVRDEVRGLHKFSSKYSEHQKGYLEYVKKFKSKS